MTSTSAPISSTSSPVSSAPPHTTSSTASSTPPPITSTLPSKRRKIKYAKVLGYLLNPYLINQQEIKNGTAIEGQVSRTFATYRLRLATYCGVKYDDIITVRNPDPDMAPIYCLVAATNLSKRSKIPRTDIIEKAKEFLGTAEEPKWYYAIRV